MKEFRELTYRVLVNVHIHQVIFLTFYIDSNLKSMWTRGVGSRFKHLLSVEEALKPIPSTTGIKEKAENTNVVCRSQSVDINGIKNCLRVGWTAKNFLQT